MSSDVAPAEPRDTEPRDSGPRDTAGSGDAPADELTGRLRRTVLQRSASSVPGREIVQVLTEIPVGVASGWHVHPGEEVGFIVAGTVRMEIADRPTLLLNAGDPFLIPPRVPHNALDLGPGTGRMLSTYFVEVGEPLSAFVHHHGEG